jgi:hypothetical protein
MQRVENNFYHEIVSELWVGKRGEGQIVNREKNREAATDMTTPNRPLHNLKYILRCKPKIGPFKTCILASPRCMF